MPSRDIDDHYRTCAETYATLRVYSDDVDPDEITGIIGVEPTDCFRKGEARTNRTDVENRNYKMNAWFFRTREASSSRDCRRHLDFLLDGPLKRPGVAAILRERGCWLDISIFYAYTGGGPTISPSQMKGLAEADVDVWWDLYRELEDGN